MGCEADIDGLDYIPIMGMCKQFHGARGELGNCKCVVIGT